MCRTIFYAERFCGLLAEPYPGGVRMGGSWVAILFPLRLFESGASPSTSYATVLVWLACLGVFSWSLFWLIVDSYKLKAAIKEFTAIIKEIEAGRISIDAVGSRLSSQATSALASLWSDYEATLLRVPEEDKGIRVYSTVPAELIFSDKTFSETAPVHNVAPSILTGLGIFGTFLGLSLGLTKVNLATQELEPLRQGLSSLLSGAHMAFITSVWGIALSIVLTGSQKIFSGRASRELGKISSTLDSLFPRKPAEVWLFEVYQEAREQTAQLKKFNDELAWNIAAALDEKLASRLAPALQDLVSALTSPLQSLRTAIEELSKTGSAAVGEAIVKEAGTELGKFKEIVEKASTHLERVFGASFELQRDLGETVSRQLALTASQVQESLGSSATRFGELTQQVEHTVEQVRQSLAEQISWQRQQFEDLLARVQDTTKGYLEEFLAKVGQTVGNVSAQSSSVVSEMSIRVHSLLEELRGHIKELGEEYAARRDDMRSAIGEIAALLTNMERLVKEAAAVLEAYQKSAQPVREAGAVLGRSVESVAEAGASLRQATSEFKVVWEEYRKHSAHTLAEIRQALLSTETAWRAYENRFGQLRQELEAVFETLKAGLSDYNKVVYEGISGCLRELDGKMGDAISSLGAGVAELKDTLDDFVGSLQQLNKTS